MRNNINKDIEVIKPGQTGFGQLIENDGFIATTQNDTISQIKEDIDNNHKFVIPDKITLHAVMQKYNLKNANGRIYPEGILRREVEKFIEERVKFRRSIMALDHPNSSTLSGHDVAGIVTNLYWEKSTLIGEIDLHLSMGFKRYGTIGTSGDKVATMILDNYMFGVSSRGLGSVENKMGSLIVGDDFELVCWDFVIDPSTPGSFVSLDKKNLEMFIENKTNNKKPIVNEQISKINSILL